MVIFFTEFSSKTSPLLVVMTGGVLSSENIRSSDLKWGIFSLLSSILDLVPRGKIRIALRPVPQTEGERVPQEARAPDTWGCDSRFPYQSGKGKAQPRGNHGMDYLTSELLTYCRNPVPPYLKH